MYLKDAGAHGSSQLNFIAKLHVAYQIMQHPFVEQVRFLWWDCHRPLRFMKGRCYGQIGMCVTWGKTLKPATASVAAGNASCSLEHRGMKGNGTEWGRNRFFRSAMATVCSSEEGAE
jgi:hypothetical protein